MENRYFFCFDCMIIVCKYIDNISYIQNIKCKNGNNHSVYPDVILCDNLLICIHCKRDIEKCIKSTDIT